MSKHDNSELQAFLDKHPDIEMFEVILCDVGGVLRGKWIERSKLDKVFNGGFKMPISTVVLDIWGRDIESMVFDNGDGDGICRADIRTLVPAPWLIRPTGQILISLDQLDGHACAVDPRNILQSLMDRLHKHDLNAVLASEMEFYLLSEQDDSMGRPIHPTSNLVSEIIKAGETYSIDLMQDMADFMHGVRDASAAQGLPVDTLIKEAAPSQYEINLYHNDDALNGADQALMLQRVIEGVAKQQGLRATFMAKPFGDLSGNGKHVHCSLTDLAGNNAFNNGTDQGNQLLQHAIAGCLASMADAMLLFAPNLNSYRRFQSGSHAPMSPNWGYENRTVSLRVPADKHEAMRIEHRMAGADANSHLVISAILAGMLYGIENKLLPPAHITGNAYEQVDAEQEKLPRYWSDAIDRFEQSTFIKEYFGAEFQTNYSHLKRQEIAEYDRLVTPLEYQSNL